MVISFIWLGSVWRQISRQNKKMRTSGKREKRPHDSVNLWTQWSDSDKINGYTHYFGHGASNGTLMFRLTSNFLLLSAINKASKLSLQKTEKTFFPLEIGNRIFIPVSLRWEPFIFCQERAYQEVIFISAACPYSEWKIKSFSNILIQV